MCIPVDLLFIQPLKHYIADIFKSNQSYLPQTCCTHILQTLDWLIYLSNVLFYSLHF